jgi:membrane-bound lytic murein transglycosylase F
LVVGCTNSVRSSEKWWSNRPVIIDINSAGTGMHQNLSKFLLGLILTGWLVFAAANCDRPLFRNDLEAIQARGVLKVITRNNGTCFYEGPHGHEGFEYDLVLAFADYLNLELELVIIDSEKVMVTELLRGNADLIAANFIVKDDLRRHLAFGPIIQEMHQLVIGKSGGTAPRAVTDLIGQPIWVRAGAFQEKRLNTLKKDYPNLTWLSVSDYESEELLEMVWRGTIPLTIADSQTIAINRKYYPELAIHFAIDESQKLAWVMDPQNMQLQDTVNQWFTLPSTV